MSKHRPKILLVEDDILVAEFFNSFFKGKASLFHCSTGQSYFNYIKKHSIDLVYTDLHLPYTTGHKVIETIKQYDDSLPIVVISSTEDIQDSINSFRAGVVDFLPKPLKKDDIQRTFTKALKLRDMVQTKRDLSQTTGDLRREIIIGQSKRILELKDDIKNLTKSEVDVLILGENGTGKELVSKSLFHQESNPTRPYITLNCSVIPKELMESVLFGHEKGSFTGAITKQIGKFELANGGDIFLDEIGTLNFELQAKLLRVLQEREIEPLGLGDSKKLDFRVIAATNESLVQMVKNKTFRKDLYFRLKKIVLEIPPLRERKDDIPILVEFFLEKHKRNGKTKKMPSSIVQALMEHSWPGNIRELENTIENLVITSRDDTIKAEQIQKIGLFDEFNDDDFNNPTFEKDTKDIKGINIFFEKDCSLDMANRIMEKNIIINVINNSSTKEIAAQKLGINRKTLYKKIQLYEISD